MRRGAKPSKARGESKLPVARKPRKNEGSRGRDLENRRPPAAARLGWSSSDMPLRGAEEL